MHKNYSQILNVKRGWRKIPHAIFYDENLTSDAKVVISELLSVSGDFHISEAGIASSVHMSLERVKKAIRLLRTNGYIQITKVKDGSRFGGYEWMISDVGGTFREVENQTLGNQTLENPVDGNSVSRETECSETECSETAPIYQIPNYQRRTIKDEEQQDRYYQEQTSTSSSTPSPTSVQQYQSREEDAEGSLPYIPSFTSQSSSLAIAPSPSKSSQPCVISQREYLYQQFLKKYPKKPTARESAETKKAFLEIPDLEHTFADIMAGLEEWCNSVDWNKEGGRYITKPLNFITTQKWEEIPRTIKTDIDPELLKSINNPDVEAYI